MDLILQPQAPACHVTRAPFAEGDRVMSMLVRDNSPGIVRFDLLESASQGFAPDGIVACRWVHVFKPRPKGENADRALKLTAETLFLALADPSTEQSPENVRLVQFLALMLERKKLLRDRGPSADGTRTRFEHGKSKQVFEVPAGEFNPEFFVAVQRQLSVLVGEPKAVAPAPEPPAAADAPAQS
jgi:hypothetical protein